MNSTVFMVFVLPFLMGVMIRFVFLKWKRSYIVSGVLVLISAIVWVWTNHLVNRGVDGTILLWALMATELTVGWLLVGGISAWVRKRKPFM